MPKTRDVQVRTTSEKKTQKFMDVELLWNLDMKENNETLNSSLTLILTCSMSAFHKYLVKGFYGYSKPQNSH